MSLDEGSNSNSNFKAAPNVRRVFGEQPVSARSTGRRYNNIYDNNFKPNGKKSLDADADSNFKLKEKSNTQGSNTSTANPRGAAANHKQSAKLNGARVDISPNSTDSNESFSLRAQLQSDLDPGSSDADVDANVGGDVGVLGSNLKQKSNQPVLNLTATDIPKLTNEQLARTFTDADKAVLSDWLALAREKISLNRTTNRQQKARLRKKRTDEINRRAEDEAS